MEKKKVQVKLLEGKVKKCENDVSPSPFKDHQTLESSIGTFQGPPNIETFQGPPSIRTFQGPPNIRTFQGPPNIKTFQGPPNIRTF